MGATPADVAPWTPDARAVVNLNGLNALLRDATVNTPEEQALHAELTALRDQAQTGAAVGPLMLEARKLINAYTWATDPSGDTRVLQEAQARLRKQEQDKPGVQPIELQRVDPKALPVGRNGMAGPGTLSRGAAEALVSIVGALSGRRVIFFSANKQSIDGAFIPTMPKHLLINADNFSTDPLATLGHEFAHSLRASYPDLYQALRDVAMAGVSDTALASQYKVHTGDKRPVAEIVPMLDDQMAGQNRTVRDFL